MTASTADVQSLEYRTEVKQLLDILAHSLYTEREIFLRELISNASDALNRIQFEMLTNHDVVDAEPKLAIHIGVDSDAKTITVADNGIGMNHAELIENLGTIAHSGARVFLQQAGKGKAALDEIIGQFGVGFYSVFMVAQEISVTSRSFRPEDQAWSWRSRGDSTYTVEPADRPNRGTTVTVKLKDDAEEFANIWRLEQIVKRHSDYVSFPIYVFDAKAGLQDDAEPVNRQTALWRQTPSQVTDDEYRAFYKQLTFDTEEPRLHIHLVADSPVNVRSILYVPAKRERSLLSPRSDHGLRLYSRKVLIQEQNKELLPEYLRFVDGVVDSEDLPLNVSREMVQSNPMMRQIRKALTGRLLKEIKALAEKDTDAYRTFWTEFGIFLKEGAALDPSSHEALTDLLRFHSTHVGTEEAWTSLADYVERMGQEQNEIYYVLGDDLKSVTRSPHLDYFRAHDIEVLYLIEPIDGFMVTTLREYRGKALRNIDDAGLDLTKRAAPDASAEDAGAAPPGYDGLMARFKSVLGERVVDVRDSKQLVHSPCRLVSPEDSFDRDLQRVRRWMEEDYTAPKKLLELNHKHPIIVGLAQVLAARPDDPLVDAVIEQLFDNALLLEGLHPNPSDMVERIQALMAAAVAPP